MYTGSDVLMVHSLRRPSEESSKHAFVYKTGIFLTSSLVLIFFFCCNISWVHEEICLAQEIIKKFLEPKKIDYTGSFFFFTS